MQHYFVFVFCRKPLCCVVHRKIRIRRKLDSKCGRRIVSSGIVAWATNNRWTWAIRFAFHLAEYKASLLRNGDDIAREIYLRWFARNRRVYDRGMGEWYDVRKKIGDDWDEGIKRKDIVLLKDWGYSCGHDRRK